MHKTLALFSLLVLVGQGCPLRPTPPPAPPVAPPKPTAPPVTPPPSQGDAAPLLLEGKNAINLDEDQKVGAEVTVSLVTLEKPGYVVIHDEVDGKPGKIIANSALLPAGESMDVKVKSVIKPDIYYWAMLHVDNGDGVYNSADDQPIKDSQDNIVMLRFEGEEAAEVMEKKPEAAMEKKPEVKTLSLTIQNFAFSPATLTVKKGDKVVVTNKDSVGHSATADAGGFDTGILSTDKSGTIDTANLAADSYPLHCTPHPFMKGTLVVE